MRRCKVDKMFSNLMISYLLIHLKELINKLPPLNAITISFKGSLERYKPVLIQYCVR
jgi:hypothetical protein